MANIQGKTVGDARYYIHSAVAIAIMVFFRFIPAPYPFTSGGMMVLGILIGAIYAFLNGNIFWGSFLGLLMIGASDYAAVGPTFASLFSNGIVMFLMLLFVLVGYLNSVGFARALALKIVQAEITRGRPWVLTFFLMLAAFIPATVMSVSATLVIALTILYAICDELGIKRTEKWAVLTAIGIATACSFALFFWPFQVVPVMLFQTMGAVGYAYEPTFMMYVLYSFIVTVLLMPATLLCIWLFKPDVTKVYNYKPPAEKAKFDSDQKFAAFIVILLLILFIVPQFLSAGTEFGRFFRQFGTVGVAAFLLALGVFIRKDGKPRIDMAKATMGLQNWPLIMMVGSVVVISDVLTRPDLGFVDWVTQVLGPVIGVNSAMGFAFIIVVIAFVINWFVQGSLVIALMVPLMIPLAQSLGFNIMPFILPFGVVINIGIILPSSHPLGAILHGHESVGGKAMIRYDSLILLVTGLISILVGVPLGFLLF